MKKIIAALFFLSAVLPLAAVGAGDMAPEISGPDKNGNTVSLSSFRGKVVMVEFWASWCGPCRYAMPKAQHKQNKFGSQGFVVFSVGLNRNKNSDIRFMKSKGYNFKAMIYTGGSGVSAYAVRGIPHAVLVGRDGRIIWRGHPLSLTEGMIKKALGSSTSGAPTPPDSGNNNDTMKTRAAVFASGTAYGPKLIGGMRYSSRGVLHSVRRSNFWGREKQARIGIIKYKNGYMKFSFRGKQYFNMMLAGGAINGRSQCRIAVYVNGRRISSGFFLNQWWNYYHIPASTFTDGINTVKIVNVSRSVPWVYRTWTDSKPHGKSKEIN